MSPGPLSNDDIPENERDARKGSVPPKSRKRGSSHVKEKQMITTPSQQAKTQTTIPLLALCLGYFMTILDVTIVNVALVDIKEHLSANVTGSLALMTRLVAKGTQVSDV